MNTSITGPNDDKVTVGWVYVTCRRKGPWKVSEEDLDYSIIRYARKVEQVMSAAGTRNVNSKQPIIHSSAIDYNDGTRVVPNRHTCR